MHPFLSLSPFISYVNSELREVSNFNFQLNMDKNYLVDTVITLLMTTHLLTVFNYHVVQTIQNHVLFTGKKVLFMGRKYF